MISWYDFDGFSHGWQGAFAARVSKQPGGKFSWLVWRSPMKLGAPDEAFGDDAASLKEAKALVAMAVDELVAKEDAK